MHLRETTVGERVAPFADRIGYPNWISRRHGSKSLEKGKLLEDVISANVCQLLHARGFCENSIWTGHYQENRHFGSWRLIPHEALAEIGDLAEYSKRVVKNLWNFGRNAAFYGKVADDRQPKTYSLAMGYLAMGKYLATFAVNVMKDSSLAKMASWRSFRPDHIHPAFAAYCNRQDQNEMTKEQAEHLKAIEYQGLMGTNSHKIISIVFEDGSSEAKKAKEMSAAITKIFKFTAAKLAPDTAPATEVEPRSSGKCVIPEEHPVTRSAAKKKRAASTPTIDEEEE